MSGEVLFFFLGGVAFYLEHSKRCGMFVEALPGHQVSFLMSLDRAGVAWRSGEVRIQSAIIFCSENRSSIKRESKIFEIPKQETFLKSTWDFGV